MSGNKDLQDQLDACATRCHNTIQNCDACQPLLHAKIKKLKPSTIDNLSPEPEFVLSISDKIIPNSNEYVEVCRIPNGKQAKIEFKGKLLSPSGCFDPFVSAYNNDRAQGWQIGGYFLKKAYPVIELQIINQDGTKTEALRYSDRIKIVDSKNGETVIKAGLKVYVVGSQGATETWQFGVYITECDAANKPRADVYLK